MSSIGVADYISSTLRILLLSHQIHYSYRMRMQTWAKPTNVVAQPLICPLLLGLQLKLFISFWAHLAAYRSPSCSPDMGLNWIILANASALVSTSLLNLVWMDYIFTQINLSTRLIQNDHKRWYIKVKWINSNIIFYVLFCI